MTTLNVKKMPQLPDDAEAYLRLNARERLGRRVELAGERRLDLNPALAAITLMMATVSAAAALWAIESANRDLTATVTFLVVLGAVVLVVALALLISGLDPHRRRRAWKEIFDYVDARHPTPFAEESTVADTPRRRWRRRRR